MAASCETGGGDNSAHSFGAQPILKELVFEPGDHVLLSCGRSIAPAKIMIVVIPDYGHEKNREFRLSEYFAGFYVVP